MNKSAALSQWANFMVDCHRKGIMTTYTRTILGEWKPQYTGAEIWCPLAGVYLTNQTDVLSCICDHMKTVYQAPSHHQGPIIRGTSEWIQMTTSKAAFMDATQMLNIPDKYRDIIWEAIQTVPGRQNTQQELMSLLDPPSWEEFYDAISKPRKQTAPGMSNVTYHDMKHWPDEIQEHCYQLLSHMWPEGHIRDSWKWRWLVGLLKSQDGSKLENLRLIGQIEWPRKLWFGINYRRVSHTWEKYDNLDHAHHGFVPNKGTDSASIHLLNILESAKGSLVNILMNMCDIKDAFDSPSYTGIQLSLWRLGLPDLVTQMIITMEAGNKTAVRTPLNQSILDKEGKAGLHNLTHEVPNAIFTPERGVPQGIQTAH